MTRSTALLFALALSGAAWAGPDAHDVRDPLIEVRSASGPMLGVELVELTPELRVHFGAGGDGMLVGGVVEGSPAAAAGIAVGDVLVRIGDSPVNELWDAREAVTEAAGGEVPVVVVRDGNPRTLTATLPEVDDAPIVHRKHLFRFEVDDADDLSELLDEHDWSVDVEELHEVLQEDLHDHLDGLSIQVQDMDAHIAESLEALELQLEELKRRVDEAGRRDDFWNGAQ